MKQSEEQKVCSFNINVNTYVFKYLYVSHLQRFIQKHFDDEITAFNVVKEHEQRPVDQPRALL